MRKTLAIGLLAVIILLLAVTFTASADPYRLQLRKRYGGGVDYLHAWRSISRHYVAGPEGYGTYVPVYSLRIRGKASPGYWYFWWWRIAVPRGYWFKVEDRFSIDMFGRVSCVYVTIRASQSCRVYFYWRLFGTTAGIGRYVPAGRTVTMRIPASNAFINLFTRGCNIEVRGDGICFWSPTYFTITVTVTPIPSKTASYSVDALILGDKLLVFVTNPFPATLTVSKVVVSGAISYEPIETYTTIPYNTTRLFIYRIQKPLFGKISVSVTASDGVHVYVDSDTLEVGAENLWILVGALATAVAIMAVLYVLRTRKKIIKAILGGQRKYVKTKTS
ncbi:hypothetical protein DRJ19_03795 [Candidatus Woesearchaeota archaeon]|nr:MAG: hypothetical protein DRJ19_03795 [Candidatus Woesearchaeota archaeon]